MKTPAVRLYETLARSTHFTDDIEEAIDVVCARNAADSDEHRRWQSLSGGEKASILIALSLHGAPVTLDLRQAFAVMDLDHAELCLDAMTETAGLS